MAKLRFHGAEPNATVHIPSIIGEYRWMSLKQKSDKDSDASASGAPDPFDTSKKEAFDDADLGFLDLYEMVIKGFNLLEADGDSRSIRPCYSARMSQLLRQTWRMLL